MNEPCVHVLNLYGHQYSIRASADEQKVLEQASLRLQEQLKLSEERYPHARTNELLVLTALNLCVPLSQAQSELEHTQARLQRLLEQMQAKLQA